MTNGELFIKENPTVETKLNESCVWIYFDGVNYFTMPTEWWEQEISLFNKIRAEIEKILTAPFATAYTAKHKALEIIDRYMEGSTHE